MITRNKPRHSKSLSRDQIREFLETLDAYKGEPGTIQLAHQERNNVRASYNHADYLLERKTMMQVWADMIDKIVTPKTSTLPFVRALTHGAD